MVFIILSSQTMKTWLAALVTLAFAGNALASSNVLAVWNFDSGIVNDLGGGYNQFGAGESSASLHFSSDVRRGDGGRSLQIVYKKADSGYCGAWIHLFDEEAAPAERKFLNATNTPFLSFHARGENGGEDFVIQAADAAWLKKDDSKPVGPVSKFLGGKLTTNWQEVVIPVSNFNVDVSQLAGLTFNFAWKGAGTVYMDDLCFKTAADADVPSSSTQEAAPRAAATPARAMWVWEIEPLLADTHKASALLGFCRDHGVNELFLQVPYGFAETNPPKVFLKQPENLKALLKAFGGQGIRVHAMDGYPEYALRPFHREVLALVAAILDFNEAANPDERFSGIHLDNEPYQLLGFDGPERENILAQYLELNDAIMVLLKERQSDLVYGVDIPFWLDEKDMDGNPRGLVTFKGVRKDAAKHIIDIVDNVGIMDYRNFACGVDGMIYHARGEIEYADKVGKKIYLGVETFKYEPTPVSFVYGMPEADWLALQTGTAGCVFSSRVNGFQVRSFTDGTRRYIGVAERAGMDRAAFNAALAGLQRLYGARETNTAALARAAAAGLKRNPDYRGFEPFALTNAVGFTTTEIMIDKITFAGKTQGEMEAVLKEVGEFYRSNPSFVGFAVHHYTTWKAMRR
jgi:hypothetical protein